MAVPLHSQLIFGREHEQARLRELLDQTIAGQGSLVLVSGEAGIGKTALVDDLARQAEAEGVLVLSGACYDLTTTPPYGLWDEVTRTYPEQDALPRLPDQLQAGAGMEGIHSQIDLLHLVEDFLTAVAAVQPLIIVLEDLHWSDQASLETLRYLGRMLGNHAILLLATFRDDELTRHHGLYQMLPLLVRESRAPRIHLNKLDISAVEAIIQNRYTLDELNARRLVSYVYQRSEGNPFFAGELLREIEDEEVLRPSDGVWLLGHLDHVDIPILLRQVLDSRYAQLQPESRHSLQVAAVIGHEIPVDLWSLVTTMTESELDQDITEGLNARVLAEVPGKMLLRFRHALVREALYSSLILSQRRSWHRRVGEALIETQYPDPDRVAYHFRQADDPRAVAWLIRAGARAEGAYAWQTAAESYEMAQAMLEVDPTAIQRRGWLLLHIGQLLRYGGSTSLGYLEEAERLAVLANDPVLVATSRNDHGLVRCFLGDIATGVAEMGAAMNVMEQATAEEKRRSRDVIASLIPEETIAASRRTSGLFRIKERLDTLQSANVLGQTYVLWLAASGRFRQAIEFGESYVSDIESATDDTPTIHDACADAYNGLGSATAALGQPEAARRWWTRARSAQEAAAHYVQVAGILQSELERLLTYATEQVTERRRIAQAGISAAERASAYWVSATLPDQMHTARLAPTVQLDVLEGRWAQVRELALSTLKDHSFPAIMTRMSIFSVLSHEQSDLIEPGWSHIHEMLVDGVATEPGNSVFRVALIAQQAAVTLSLDAGDLAQAKTWLQAHDRWLEWSGAVLGQPEGQLLWARYERQADDLAAARQHAEAALDRSSDPRQPLALIAAHRFLGQLDVDENRFDDAAGHLSTSLELAEACAAPYEQARTMLVMAELAAKTNQPDEARRLLAEVRTICEPLQARRTLTQTDEIEARLAKTTGGYPAGLSAREVEVLRFVARGMTSAEVAEELFISPRTVSQHLRNAYNKIGVNNRAEATKFAVEHGIA